jgi:3-deoxy-manno-octulosonate cytidylyltransferase (CMP-KDO synthetase)
MGSTRFPAKALADETGKPLVVHVCEQAAGATMIERVVVATDSQDIRRAVELYGYEAVLTGEHPNGTSRIAEAASVLGLSADQVVVNVQGDEPEIDPEVIDAAGHALMFVDGLGAGTVVTPITDDTTFNDPNVVKAVLGPGICTPEEIHRALYFTRSPAPYARDEAPSYRFRHVGIYAYTVDAIRTYLKMEQGQLERLESLEQLRWLEHGHEIQAAVADSSHTGIDTPEQYRAFVERHAQKNHPI